MRAAAIGIGGFFFRYRNTVFPVVLIALYLLAPPPKGLFGSVRLEHLKDVVAVLLALGGLFLRALVIGYAYIKRGGKGKKVYATDLVTGGMFSLSRNPLYLGNILICCGIFLMHGDPLVMLLAIGFFLFAYRMIVFAEEAFLLEKFGDAYRAYCADVPRWLPRFSRFKEATAGMTFNVGRVVRKDFTQIMGTVAILAATEAYESIGWPPTFADAGYLRGLAAIIIVCAILGVTVQVVKKRMPQST